MCRLAIAVVLLGTGPASADIFDQLTNPDLTKLITSDGATQLSMITSKELAVASTQNSGVVGAVVVVKTGEGRQAKLLVQPGMQKFGMEKRPIILISRFATFKDGQEQATVARGDNVPLYESMAFNCDVGHIVNGITPNDVSVVNDTATGQLTLKATAPSTLYLIRQLPKSSDRKAPSSFEPGGAFEPRFFNGSYKLTADGRRSGTLKLDVDEASGEVTGSFYSDKDGRKYEVAGKIGNPRHQIAFTIKFPRAREQFQGYLFTGDGKAIAGTSKLQDRDGAFYAVRTEGQ